jgi:hypothetical protein
VENKLTDKEIVKALECCSKDEINGLNIFTYGGVPMRSLLRYALTYINRLEEENEKLKNDLEWLNGQYLIQDMALQTAKAEAYKEFARELMLIPRNTVRKDEIKNLLKEKVGEDNAK